MATKLIGYLAYGYPTIEKSIETAEVYIKSGCDVIEVGYPTDNAYLDNETIQNTMKDALNKTTDPERYFAGIGMIRKNHPEVELLFLVYEHTIVEIGYNKFVELCREEEIEDIILVGNKDEIIKDKLIKDGFKISIYVTYELPENPIKEALNSNGFVYLQAKPSGLVKEGYETLDSCIGYLREKGIKTPIYAGVGIQTAEDVNMVSKAGADGVFLGSALLKIQEDYEKLSSFIKMMKGAIE